MKDILSSEIPEELQEALTEAESIIDHEVNLACDPRTSSSTAAKRGLMVLLAWLMFHGHAAETDARIAIEEASSLAFKS